MNLRSADLNLFVLFEALLVEKSVSKAARRVGLSQPAASNALGRLRETLGDPLFVRRGSAMLPTPRAEQIAAHVRSGLSELGTALGPPLPFDPGASDRTFTIAASDFAAFIVLPPMMQRVREEAPRVTVRIVPYGDTRPYDALLAGTLDVMLGAAPDVPPGIATEDFMGVDFAVAVRAEHPRVRRRLTLRQYVELDHLLVSPFGGSHGTVDRALDLRGLQRRVALYVPDFLLAPHVIARTDLIVTLARPVLDVLAPPLGLRLFDPPLPLSPFPYSGMWDERRETDPAHRWLRALIRRALDDVRGA